MAWTAASCREPAGLLAADRRDGVSLGVVPELHHRFDSEPGAGRILSASASQSGRPGFGRRGQVRLSAGIPAVTRAPWAAQLAGARPMTDSGGTAGALGPPLSGTGPSFGRFLNGR